MSKRIERVNKVLKEEINKILLRDLDFGGALVTIIDVETGLDLRYCNIKISILPEDKEKWAFKILENKIYDIQKTLNKKLNMRPVPRIRFEIDQGTKKLHRIDEILGGVEN